MNRKHHLIYINIKNTLYIYKLISFKFNCIPYKIEKVIVCINEIYLCVHTNLIIYIIVTDFLIGAILLNITFLFCHKNIPQEIK